MALIDKIIGVRIPLIMLFLIFERKFGVKYSIPNVESRERIKEILNIANGEDISTIISVVPSVLIGSLFRLNNGAADESTNVIPARIIDIENPHIAANVKTLIIDIKNLIKRFLKKLSSKRLIPPIITERCRPDTTIM